MKTTSTILLSAFALAASTVLATAQDNNNQNRDRGGDRRGNYEDFQKRMNERLKASLKVTDEEWSVMQPLIEKVQTKQRDAMGSRFGGGRPRGDNNSGGASSGPARPGEAESNALRTAVENEGTSPEEIKAKLAAVRNQRQKAAGELAQAREELKKVVTVRQEATLVSMGLLE